MDQDADTDIHPDPVAAKALPSRGSKSRLVPLVVGVGVMAVFGGFWLWGGLGVPTEPVSPDTSSAVVVDQVVATPQETGIEPETTTNPINEEVLEENAAEPEPVVEEAVIATVELSETEKLLEAGHKALKEDRLTTPEKNNANYYYLKALELDPGSRDAKRGRLQIANRYHALALSAFNNGDPRKAREYIGRGRPTRLWWSC